MNISIASGKGGTGKTTVALNLSFSIDKKINLYDLDVEEPNCHIFLPKLKYNSKTVYTHVPAVNTDKCTLCGKCAEVCQYNAIAVTPSKVLLFKELCHSCGGCSLFCPEKAISEVPIEIGKVISSNYKNINFSYGELKVGHPTSPPLISAVKKEINSSEINVLDCPPGTSCPAIEAVKDSDFCILVSDPTPFGVHDLKLSVRALRHLKIPFGVVINRSDIGDDRLEIYCKDENIPVLLRIPDDRKIAETYSKGEIVVEALPQYKEGFKNLFEKIKEVL